MKFLTVVLFGLLAIHAASAGLKLLPEPWCVCGTFYKLKLDPWKIEHGYEHGCRPKLTTLDVSSPGSALCSMKQAFIDKLHNPLDFCPHRPSCGSCGSCGHCGCYRY